MLLRVAMMASELSSSSAREKRLEDYRGQWQQLPWVATIEAQGHREREAPLAAVVTRLKEPEEKSL